MPLAHAPGRQHRSQPLFQEAFVLNLSISRRPRIAGFTFIEMLLVFVIMGIMLSITVKSVRGTWVASSRRSASREVTSYLFRARAIAIQQSRTAWLVRSGNVLKIMVDSSGTPVRLGTQIDMSARYGATLRSEEHTSELQSRLHLVCRLLLEKKKKKKTYHVLTAEQQKIHTLTMTHLSR